MERKPIKLSDDIVIPCPMYGFGLRRAYKCLSCDHYRGTARATVNGKEIEGDDIDALQVICGKPITRRMQRLVSE